MFKFIFPLLSLMILFHLTQAQQGRDYTMNAFAAKYPKPKFVLLMLHLSSNKIEALKSRGMSEDIPAVMEADENLNKAIMNDFKNNFKFCQVYFFYDSLFEKAKEKKWDEIVFYDFESLNAKKQVFTNNFDNYFFAEISYPSPDVQLQVDESVPERLRDPYQGDEGSVSHHNQVINLYDQDFTPLKGKSRYVDISLLRRRGALEFAFSPALKFDKFLRKKYLDHDK